MARKQQQQKPKKTSSKTSTSSNQRPQISPSSDVANSPSPQQQLHSLRAQQRLLDIFSHSFHSLLTADDDFPLLLRELKQRLFDRDFDAAFGREGNLRIYAARWSPTRALCYASVLEGIGEQLEHLWMPDDDDDDRRLVEAVSNHEEQDRGEDKVEEDGESIDRLSSPPPSPPPPGKGTLKMLSIGGCAAEHVAFASYLHTTHSNGSLTLIDSAPWAQVISTLQERITSPPLLSEYASAAVKAANKPLLHTSQLSTNFLQNDILSVDRHVLAQLAGSRPLLVTLLFTLNELYTIHGIGKTTTFLKTLGDVLPLGSLLLVVDSPGSYSEAAVGKERKKYPMQWILNHTLLETTKSSSSPQQQQQRQKWRRLESQDSIWFRLPEALSYPIQLENMRYQMHLYKREDNSEE